MIDNENSSNFSEPISLPEESSELTIQTDTIILNKNIKN